jgi:hypothetical protein
MTMDQLKEMLLWCAGINYAILLVWFAAFVAAHQGLYRLHTRWFPLSAQTFDALHYGGMSVYKIGILLLNLVPRIALSLAT